MDDDAVRKVRVKQDTRSPCRFQKIKNNLYFRIRGQTKGRGTKKNILFFHNIYKEKYKDLIGDRTQQGDEQLHIISL